MTKLKDLLEYLAKELVSKPKEVKVVESTEEDGTIHLTLSIALDDMGMIIGKGGRTIMAIRSLVKTAAVKVGKKVFLELEEVAPSKSRTRSEITTPAQRDKDSESSKDSKGKK